MAKVLIIDDEPNVLDFVCRLVEGEGHSTIRATDCAEGLTAAEDPSVDVIIADIFLPDSNDPSGWLDKVKTMAGERPLIFITGYPSQELMDKSSSLGAAALLTKPFEMVFIKDLLAKITARKQDD